MVKLYKVITRPRRIISYLAYNGYLKLLNDKLYLRLLYWASFGRSLNLSSPKSYNEKLQWLKLYYRNPIQTQLVDKYEVKPIVAKIIGQKYIIPTIGIYNTFDDIDFSILPNKFVIKCTHDSGGIVICKDKAKLDIEQARKKINSSLKCDFYYALREWPYKDVKPRVIIEEYMEDKQSNELRDYKFFCFDGKVRALFIASDRFNKDEETKFDFFDEDFNHLDFQHGHPNANIPPKKPQTFEEMKALASKISKGYPHMRVDFYEVDGRVYFGEITFFHHGGIVPFKPDEWDYMFGEWLKLPPKR